MYSAKRMFTHLCVSIIPFPSLKTVERALKQSAARGIHTTKTNRQYFAKSRLPQSLCLRIQAFVGVFVRQHSSASSSVHRHCEQYPHRRRPKQVWLIHHCPRSKKAKLINTVPISITNFNAVSFHSETTRL